MSTELHIKQLRFDYDTTTVRLRRKLCDISRMGSALYLEEEEEKLICSFFARVESRGMEAGARDTSYSDRSRIVVESQL